MLASQLPNCETFATLINRGVHKPCGLFGPTLCCNPSIFFSLFEFKVWHDSDSFSTSRKCSLPKNVCPRVNSILLGPRPRSSSNIICSSSESYITVSWYLKLLGLWKGLEKFNCHTEKSSRGLQPPVHRPSGCLVVRRITYVISHIGGVIHE